MSKVVTGRVRLSYVYLTKPKVDDNGNSKYSVVVLLPKSDLQTKAAIDAAIAQAIEEGKSKKWNGLVPPNVPIPVKDGDGVRQDGTPFGDECKGHWVFAASTNADAGRPRPQILGPDFQDIINPSEIYSGMYGRVSVNFAPYYHKQAGKKGIGCYLNHVQKLEDGGPLGATKASAEDDFGVAPVLQSQYQTPQGQYQQPMYQTPQGQYQQPMYQAPTQYQQPMQNQYQQAPIQPQYQQPMYQQPMAQPQIDPFTGLPMNGGVMGL